MAKRGGNGTTSMKKTTVSLPKDLYTRLLHAKVDEERDIQEIVADALRRYFTAKGKRGTRS